MLKSMETRKGRRTQWIDVQKPTERDLARLKKDFNLHPVILEELRGPSARARVEQYDCSLFFIYYFPLYDRKDAASVRTEIDFIVTANAVATVHYQPLGGVLKDFKITTESSSLEVFYALLKHLLVFEERQLRHIREKVESIGREIFRDREKEVLEKVMVLKRDISEYRIIVRLQDPILRSLLQKGKAFWDADAEIYLNDIIGEHLKIASQLEDYREATSDFEDTNNQLMNLKINSVMKTFTLLSFLTFPFVLLVGLFSMRAMDTPLVDQPH